MHRAAQQEHEAGAHSTAAGQKKLSLAQDIGSAAQRAVEGTQAALHGAAEANTALGGCGLLGPQAGACERLEREVPPAPAMAAMGALCAQPWDVLPS